MSIFYAPVRRVVYLSTGILSTLFFKDKKDIFILCYHAIGNDGWDFSVRMYDFIRQIEYLGSKYDFLRLKDLALYLKGRKKLSRSAVILTFDDGYKDILEVSNFLQTKKIKPTIFVESDPEHVSRQELGTNKELLTLADIKKLVNRGWEVGSHTATHPNMNELSKRMIDKEIINSKTVLEKNLGFKVRYVAYPKGIYNSRILKAVSTAGYEFGLTMDDTDIKPGTNPLLLPRIGVDGTHSFEEFKVLTLPLVSKSRKLLKKVLFEKDKLLSTHKNFLMNKFKLLVVKIKLFFINTKDYLFTLQEPSKKIVSIKPFDPKAKKVGEKWLKKVRHEFPELVVRFVGSTALELPGKNDIDLIAECTKENLDTYTSSLSEIFGQPTNKSKSFSEWKTKHFGYDIELYLATKNSRIYKGYVAIFEAFKGNKNFRHMYENLKIAASNLSIREYERRRKKLFNEIIFDKYQTN